MSDHITSRMHKHELVFVPFPGGIHLCACTAAALKREAESTGKPLAMVIRAAIARGMKVADVKESA